MTIDLRNIKAPFTVQLRSGAKVKITRLELQWDIAVLEFETKTITCESGNSHGFKYDGTFNIGNPAYRVWDIVKIINYELVKSTKPNKYLEVCK